MVGLLPKKKQAYNYGGFGKMEDPQYHLYTHAEPEKVGGCNLYDGASWDECYINFLEANIKW